MEINQEYLEKHAIQTGFLPSHLSDPTCELGDSVAMLDNKRIIFISPNSLYGTPVPTESITHIQWTGGRQK